MVVCVMLSCARVPTFAKTTTRNNTLIVGEISTEKQEITLKFSTTGSNNPADSSTDPFPFEEDGLVRNIVVEASSGTAQGIAFQSGQNFSGKTLTLNNEAILYSEDPIGVEYLISAKNAAGIAS